MVCRLNYDEKLVIFVPNYLL